MFFGHVGPCKHRQPFFADGMTYDNQNYEHTQSEMQHDLQLLPKRMCFFAVEHIDVLMFGFGC